MCLTFVNVFVVASHFSFPGRSKNVIVTAVAGRDLSQKKVWLGFREDNTVTKLGNLRRVRPGRVKSLVLLEKGMP